MGTLAKFVSTNHAISNVQRIRFKSYKFDVFVAYLIVPVGDGNGDEYGYSCSGMFILSGASCLGLGGLGTLLGAVSSTNEENQILMLVEGNRKTHLSREEIKTCIHVQLRIH